MSIFKAKANFFSASYYKELLNELKVIGIVFAAVQLIYGIAGEFGGLNGLGPLSLFSIGGSIMKTHPDCLSLFFFICGLNFISTHISRKNWDFRNSLPIAKRTMFACHFAAVLSFAAIIYAANFLGVFIGEGIRAIVKSTTVPDGFGMSALSMLESIVGGISGYCLLVILGSIVNRVLSVLAAIAVYIGLPVLFPLNVFAVSDNRIFSSELFFPLGLNAANTLNTLLSLVCMLLLVVLAYIAFGKSRVETFQKPARTKWIHIIIGVLGAGCVGLIVSGLSSAIIDSQPQRHVFGGVPIYEYSPWIVRVIVIGGIAMLLAYFIYMLLTMKSFKNALKSCVFMPLAFLVVGASVLVGVLSDKKYEKLDFSAENIDSIRVTDECFTSSEREYYQNALFHGYSYDENLSVHRGSSRVFDVEIRDEAVKKTVSQLAEASLSYNARLSILGGIFTGANGAMIKPIEVTLKDGTKWMVINDGQVSLNSFAGNTELMEKLGSLDRFKNGKVIDPYGLGSELERTLLDELAALSPEERARILTGRFRRSTFEQFYETNPKVEDGIAQLGFSLTLSSPTYDHVATVLLSDKLPKTTELYMKLMNERIREHKDYKEFISRLKSADIGSFNINTMDMESCTGEAIYAYRGEPYLVDGEFVPEFKELCALIAECIEANEPVSGADRAISFKVENFMVFEQRANGYFTDRYLFGRTPMLAYVGIGAEKAARLTELLKLMDEKYDWRPGEPGAQFYSYPNEKEASYIAETMREGKLKVFDEGGTELEFDVFMDMFYNGSEFFYDEDGGRLHITELFEKAYKLESAPTGAPIETEAPETSEEP